MHQLYDAQSTIKCFKRNKREKRGQVFNAFWVNNSSGLIDPKTFSFDSVRLFKIIAHDKCHKNKTCDLYEKMKLGWKKRKLVFSLLDCLILL